MSVVYEYSDEDFLKLIENGKNISDVLKSMGLASRGGNCFKLIKKRIKEMNLDTSHFDISKTRGNKVFDLSEILVENSSYYNITRLKIRLVSEKKLEYKCEFCKNSGLWQGKKLSLQLDHKNGINNDHRLENLRFLCPNCHAQTHTYAGKNKIKDK